MRIRKIKVISLVQYINILLIIALSNTVYFGLAKRNITLFFAIGFMAFCTIFIIPRYKCRSTINNAVIYLSFLLLLLVDWAFNAERGNLSFRNGYIGYAICLSLTYFSTMLFKKRRLCEVYVNLMIIISIISLAHFFVAVMFPSVAQRIPMGITEQGYYYSMFYTWGWRNHGWGLYLFSRNSGPFWEPGAFQGFLVVAVLFCFYAQDIIIKADKKLIILLVTLITTQSTTGLILFIIICIGWIRDIMKMLVKGKSSKELRLLFFLFCGMVIIIWLVSSGIVTSKLANYSQANTSAGIRLTDFTQSLKLVKVSPLFGTGLGTELTKRWEASVGISMNSNGLLLMIYTMGIPFSIIYIFMTIKNSMSFVLSKSALKKISAILIIMIIQLTECVFIFPVYFIMLFDYIENKL